VSVCVSLFSDELGKQHDLGVFVHFLTIDICIVISCHCYFSCCFNRVLFLIFVAVAIPPLLLCAPGVGHFPSLTFARLDSPLSLPSQGR
jgi:hypothetical protein